MDFARGFDLSVGCLIASLGCGAMAETSSLTMPCRKARGNLHAGWARLGAGAGYILRSCLIVATGMVLLGHVRMTSAKLSNAMAFL